MNELTNQTEAEAARQHVEAVTRNNNINEAELERYYLNRAALERYELLGGETYLNDENLQFTTSGEISVTLQTIRDALQETLLINTLSFNHHNAGKDVKAEDNEFLLHKTLTENGVMSTYSQGSHKKGTDIHVSIPGVEEEQGISVKSGTYNPATGLIIVSGSRTTSYPTLAEKLAALHETRSEVYFLFSKTKVPAKEDRKLAYKEYRVTAFDGTAFSLGEEKDWHSIDGKHTLLKPQGLVSSADIRPKMSDQLWYTLNTRHKDYPHIAATVRVPKI